MKKLSDGAVRPTAKALSIKPIEPAHVESLRKALMRNELVFKGERSFGDPGIVAEFMKKALSAIVDPQTHKFLVAVRGRNIVGFANATMTSPTNAESGWTYSFEGKTGLGRMLFDEKIKALKGEGASKITGQVVEEGSSMARIVSDAAEAHGFNVAWETKRPRNWVYTRKE